ncbi:MAG: tetratricopeptide repeat protein [Pseudomonadota bacterium]
MFGSAAPSMKTAFVALLVGLTPVTGMAATLDLNESIGKATSDVADAVAMLNSGDREGARAAVERLLLVNPFKADALELYGAILALDGDLTRAIDMLESSVKVDPLRSSAHTKLGDIAMALEAYPQAEKYFREAINVNPFEARAHQRLAILAERRGDVGTAIDHYEKGLRVVPEEFLGQRLDLARLYNVVGRFDESVALLEPYAERVKTAGYERTLGAAYLGAGDPARALTRFEAAARLAPEDVGTLIGIGDAHRTLGDTDKAIAAFRAAITIDAWSEPAQAALATTYLAIGDEPAAREIYAKMLALDPVMDQPVAAFGRYLMEIGENGQAEDVFKQIIAADVTRPTGHLGLGQLYGFLQEYDAASLAFSEGLRFSPDDEDLLRGAGAVALRRGELDNALEYTTRRANLAPRSPDAQFQLGMIHDARGEPNLAVRAYRAAVHNSDDYWPAMNNLAMALIAMGEPEAALRYARQAVNIGGDNPILLHTLGLAELKAGNADRAKEALTLARDQNGESYNVRIHLAEAHLATGDARAARLEAETALTLAATQGERKRVEDFLAEL